MGSNSDLNYTHLSLPLQGVRHTFGRAGGGPAHCVGSDRCPRPEVPASVSKASSRGPQLSRPGGCYGNHESLRAGPGLPRLVFKTEEGPLHSAPRCVEFLTHSFPYFTPISHPIPILFYSPLRKWFLSFNAPFSHHYFQAFTNIK